MKTKHIFIIVKHNNTGWLQQSMPRMLEFTKYFEKKKKYRKKKAKKQTNTDT